MSTLRENIWHLSLTVTAEIVPLGIPLLGFYNKSLGHVVLVLILAGRSEDLLPNDNFNCKSNKLSIFNCRDLKVMQQCSMGYCENE